MMLADYLKPRPDVKELKANRDVRGLIRALQYKRDLDVRAAAAFALGSIGNSLAVEALVKALKDKFVRWEAAAALKMVGEPAVQPLTQAASAGDIYVQRVARRTLESISSN